MCFNCFILFTSFLGGLVPPTQRREPRSRTDSRGRNPNPEEQHHTRATADNGRAHSPHPTTRAEQRRQGRRRNANPTRGGTDSARRSTPRTESRTGEPNKTPSADNPKDTEHRERKSRKNKPHERVKGTGRRTQSRKNTAPTRHRRTETKSQHKRNTTKNFWFYNSTKVNAPKPPWGAL